MYYVHYFVEWEEVESTWYVRHYWTCCTSPGWQMSMEQAVECEFVRETEVLGGNLPRFYFVQHETHMTWPAIEPG
jgi:hypothetical protein